MSILDNHKVNVEKHKDNSRNYQSATKQTYELGWLSYLSNILSHHWPKSGGQKIFCSLRSQNLSRPHFQNRGAASGSEVMKFDISHTQIRVAVTAVKQCLEEDKGTRSACAGRDIRSCMLHVSDWSSVSLSAAVTHRPVKPVLTLDNLLLARACALHDSSHYRRAPPRILFPHRIDQAETKLVHAWYASVVACWCSTRGAARPIIAQRTTCASVWQDESQWRQSTVRSFISTQLFSIVILWAWSACSPFRGVVHFHVKTCHFLLLKNKFDLIRFELSFFEVCLSSRL